MRTSCEASREAMPSVTGPGEIANQKSTSTAMSNALGEEGAFRRAESLS